MYDTPNNINIDPKEVCENGREDITKHVFENQDVDECVVVNFVVRQEAREDASNELK